MSASTRQSPPNLSARLSTSPTRKVFAFASALAVAPLLVLASMTARVTEPPDQASWREHRDRIRQIPDESYRYDRFRAVRGQVTDGDGRPVGGAVVRCSRVDNLLRLAEVGPLSTSKWEVPVDSEAAVGSDGKYDFPHLPDGAYTFFYSAPGMAPAIKDLVVVQDGLGAVLDVTLGRPDVLRVRFDFPPWPRNRLTLVPHRWWPELPTMVVEPLGSAAEFAGLGGPLRRGLIVASGDSDDSAWRVVGRYDLGDSSETRVGISAPPASPDDLPEVAAVERRGDAVQPAIRRFYASISPAALLWPEAADDSKFLAAMAEFQAAGGRNDKKGDARGFGPLPFLPILAEAPEGGAWFGWANDASEFSFSGLPSGPYRLRALDLFGRVTSARGAFVTPRAVANLSNGAWRKPELDTPDAGEILGFVRWEGGVPAAKAAIIVQHTRNFRLYLRRVEADENGFFRAEGVPDDEPYFAFAMPPGEDGAMRQFNYFASSGNRRESWLDLTLHPHRISGQVPGSASLKSLDLVRIQPEGDRAVWSVRADPSGRFSITNVPHGRYRLDGRAGLGSVRSLPFDVTERVAEVEVLWEKTSS